MPTSRTGPLTRRTVLAATVVATGLSGCAVGAQPSRARPASSPTTAAGEESSDVTVATEALAAVRRVEGAVTGTAHRFRTLRADLSGFAEMHRAHDQALADAVPRSARAQPERHAWTVPHKRAKALQRLRAAEQDLHDRLGDLAGRAESGDFARLLAAMGAAVAQRLEEWPDE